VGSQARILYADVEGRLEIAKAFNDAISHNEIGPVAIGRDHHDTGGTDSPFRETVEIGDGSEWTADMSVHNFAGDCARGATWASLHNGGGVGPGKVINGGFGMLMDGSQRSCSTYRRMQFFDIVNGLTRRAWAGRTNAIWTLKRISKIFPEMYSQFNFPNCADRNMVRKIVKQTSF
jgi:urocanate hydratase